MTTTQDDIVIGAITLSSRKRAGLSESRIDEFTEFVVTSPRWIFAGDGGRA